MILLKNVANWGVLGCAGIAKSTVIPSILNAANANLYAIASRGPGKLEQFAELFQPEKTYIGYDALLDDPLVDIVYIPLPNSLHCEWVVKACGKKKHVLCEKPLAMNAREVGQIQQAAQKNHVAVMEAFAYLHGPLMDKVRKILASGRLGKIKYMESNFSYLLTDLNNVRLIRDIGGGATYDLGCYPISFFREVTGEEPDRVLPMTTIGEKSGVDEDVLLALSFPGGAKACSYYSFQSYRSVRNDRGAEKSIFVLIDGEREEIVVDCSVNYIKQAEQMSRVALLGEISAVSLPFSLGNAKVLDRIL